MQTLSLLLLTSSFAAVIITMTTRGHRLKIIANISRNKLLSQSTHMVFLLLI